MSSSCSIWTSRSRTAPSVWPTQTSSSLVLSATSGSTSAKSAMAARSRRFATRMSCSASMSSPSRVPGSFASKVEKCRRRTARATAPIVISGSISLTPNRRAAGGPRSWDRSPTSNLLRPAGCNAHASRNSRTNASNVCVAAVGTSISTRCNRTGDPPPCGRIVVSSNATIPDGEPAAVRAKVRRRVRTSSSGRSRFVPLSGTHPAADGAVGALECLHVRAFQALAHLESAARSRSTDGSRVESLQRRLGTAPATETANPKRVARLLEAPVIGLDVDIDLVHAVSVCNDLRSRRVTPPLGLIQPALYGTKVDRVELPFDLLHILNHPLRNRAEIVASCSLLL